MSILQTAVDNFRIINDPHGKYVVTKMSIDKLDENEDYNVDFNLVNFSKVVYITFVTIINEKVRIFGPRNRNLALAEDITWFDIHTKLDLLIEFSHVHREDKNIEVLKDVMGCIEDIYDEHYLRKLRIVQEDNMIDVRDGIILNMKKIIGHKLNEYYYKIDNILEYFSNFPLTVPRIKLEIMPDYNFSNSESENESEDESRYESDNELD